MLRIEKVMRNTNWKLLAKQKQTMLGLKGLPLADQKVVDGLVNFLDAIMDAAEQDGYPVVFLTEQ